MFLLLAVLAVLCGAVRLQTQVVHVLLSRHLQCVVAVGDQQRQLESDQRQGEHYERERAHGVDECVAGQGGHLHLVGVGLGGPHTVQDEEQVVEEGCGHGADGQRQHDLAQGELEDVQGEILEGGDQFEAAYQ